MLKFDFMSGVKNGFYPYRWYNLKNRVVFIHIPKAAGTSIIKALGGNSMLRDHLPYWVYKQAGPRKFDSYFKFSVTRNPEDRLVSLFRYLKKGGNGREFPLLLESAKHDVEYFLNFLEGNSCLFRHKLLWPQCDFVLNPEGKLEVDLLLALENIEEGFCVVAERVGLKGYTLKRENSSMSFSLTDQERRDVVKFCELHYRDDYWLHEQSLH